MNKRDYIRWKNKWMQKLDRDSRRHVDCFRCSKGETKEHVNLKLKLFLEFQEYERMTEILSENRKFRADLIIFRPYIPLVIEVKHTESDESLERKRIFWESEGFDYIIKETNNMNEQPTYVDEPVYEDEPEPEEPVTEGNVKAPNCPTCGEFMDKIEAWVCKKCGQLHKSEK